MLERTSVVVFDDGEVEVRFLVGLPARGRRVMGHAAAELLTEDVPGVVEAALTDGAIDLSALQAHLEVVEDQQALRASLDGAGLVAFLADGARLPRCSGVDDRPLADGVLSEVLAAIEAGGLEAIQRSPAGDLAAFRRFELAAFMNRLRGLRVQ